MIRNLTTIAFILLLTCCRASRSEAADETDSAISKAEFTAEQIEFFETKIRPLLVERCFECHSGKSKKLQAGLLLDSRKGVLKGGEAGPVIDEKNLSASALLQAVKYQASEMPPDGKLKDDQIASIVKWVEMGLPWPAGDQASVSKTGGGTYDWATVRKSHWAWQPVRKPAIPQMPKSVSGVWRLNSIDAFIAASLFEAGLQPGDPAEARLQLRRVYLDLIGLPPTPEQVEAFEQAFAEVGTSALSAVVDELLSSPHYGERWGRHWLDVARYSDGFGGFLDNAALPQAWRYRDWVVQALNDDMPYDQFIRLQIAGDLIGKSREDGIATGFFALGPTYRSDGGDPDSVAQAQSETLDDRLDTLGRGFMALTVACARCHDHKFDPIPQQDYYSLAGIFRNSNVRELPLADGEIVKTYNDHQNAIRSADKRIKDLQNKVKKEKRELTAEEKQQIAAWGKELETLKKTAPAKYDTAHALGDSGSGDMNVALRGNLRKPGSVAPRRFLRVFAGDAPPRFTDGSGRIKLAEAIAVADNPLTARVIVNRIWLHHFGKALVRSPGNFGILGQKPTHPELLDWLAATFIEDGWSIKSLHRRIILSQTYQQSSRIRDHAFEVDGDNRYVWRMNPRRMDVEAWRDSLLASTGELDRSFGGPPLDNIAAAKRRTLYAKVSRNGDRFASDELLRLFDFPLMRATVARRPLSIVPQQFLFLLNSQFMVDRAKALAARLQSGANDDAQRIDAAYQLLFARPATSEEREIGLTFLNQTFDEVPEKKEPVPLESDRDLLIADFESSSYEMWKAEGAAFGNRPANGTIGGQMTVTGFLGGGLVNSFLPNDRPTGRLTSPPWKIERKYIRFLIGGGGYPGKTCMNLMIDGKVVRTAVGPNVVGGGSEKLSWAHWDVAEYSGQTAVIQIVDDASGGWGHINVDHIFQSKLKDGPVPGAVNSSSRTVADLSRWVQYTQMLLSSNEFMFVR